jgi:gluconokinase
MTTLRVIIIMGVAGAGKTLIGSALAREIGWLFRDADEFHSKHNVEKMSRGEGLTDEDRAPWLAAMRAVIADTIARNGHLVLACSALKQWYRDALIPPGTPAGVIKFVHLDVSEAVLRQRLEHRSHHFAHADLLPSQLATLEPPLDALTIDGARPPDDIVRDIRRALGL